MAIKLPVDCEAYYYPEFMAEADSEELFNFICDNNDFSKRKFRTYDGTEYNLDASAMMFVDAPLVNEFQEEIWGRIVEFPPLLAELNKKIENITLRQLRVCRCLYYLDGSLGSDFHTDLPAYGSTSCIASISLGEEREFVLRNAQDHSDIYSLDLKPGSLLIMGDGCQDRYQHALPVNDRYKNPRINLTFRAFGWD